MSMAWDLPTLLGLTLFWIGPVVASLLISFTDWGSAPRVSWLGLENYRGLFTSPLFWKVFQNTWYYTLVSVPAGLLLSLCLALLANQKLRGIGIFRAATLPTGVDLIPEPPLAETPCGCPSSVGLEEHS